jgi:hypothetical protein
MKATTVLAAALAATLGYSASAQANIIDLFDDPALPSAQFVRDTNGVQIWIEYDGNPPPSPTIIGGSRDLIIQATEGFIPANPDPLVFPGVGASLGVIGGQLRYSNDVAVKSNAEVQWDGDDDSPALTFDTMLVNLVNQPGCPATGCNTFIADVIEADLGFTFTLGVYTDANNWSTLTATSQGVDVNVGELAVFPYEWFLLADGDYNLAGLPFTIFSSNPLANEDVDFTEIRALNLKLTGVSANVDLRIDSVTKTKIPEPGTLALLGIGILAGGMAGRRRETLKA